MFVQFTLVANGEPIAIATKNIRDFTVDTYLISVLKENGEQEYLSEEKQCTKIYLFSPQDDYVNVVEDFSTVLRRLNQVSE